MASSKHGSARESHEYKPCIWGDYFITHPLLTSTNKESEIWMKTRVEMLLGEVKEMFLRGANDSVLSDMQLIDTLQRLGIDYHFEDEIKNALIQIHDTTSVDSGDLHAVALRFRLLRQHCYDISSDVFEEFMDGHGKFRLTIGTDVKSILSLYEAAYLGKPGEYVLDEAITFTRSQLMSTTGRHNVEPHLKSQVLHALETPLRRRMQRLEARQYISIYEGDLETRNDVVLELAKLDFHLLQMLHQQEIRTISMWWKNFGIPAKLSFARDRIVETYFWTLAISFEPHCSRARMMTTKVTQLLTDMDDLYDNYGTLDELQQYTYVIQRWDLEDAEQLEECCKLHFLALNKTLKEIEDELESDGFSYRVHYLKETIKETTRAYLAEIKWREEKCVPSFEDHLRVSLVTSCFDPITCVYFIGMGDVVTKEVLDWVISFPKIIKSTAIICRLMDDVVSHERESKRNHVASTVQCYMKEHGTSLEETCNKLVTMVEDEWRNINKEFLAVKLPIPLLTQIINNARVMETMYKKIDGYTNPEQPKEYIMLLLVQPVVNLQ